MTNKDAIYRQDVLDLAKKGVLISNGNYESVCKAINEIPPVNPTEPCKDAIDRAEAIKIASGYCHPANVAKELAKLPAVNPQPCEDAISRQAVQDYVAKYLSQYLYEDVREAVEVIDEYIGELPPVNPTKTGHWMPVKGYEGILWECSECHNKRHHTTIKWNYCPDCGAKMSES